MSDDPVKKVGPLVDAAVQKFDDMRNAMENPVEEIAPANDGQFVSRQRTIAVNSLRSRANIPKRHRQTQIVPEPAWAEARLKLKHNLGEGTMVALVGYRGNGKTQLAVDVILDRIDAHLSPCLFTTAVGFFLELRGTYGRDSKLTERQVFSKYLDPDLLVIDEIGKRSESEWENNMLFELLNSRYNELKDTILIDNRSKQHFIATIGPSIADRMNETGGIIECDWESFRK